MGLFSSKSKTYVSTVTYPIGSDNPDDRVDFAKYVVLNSILQGKDISQSLTQSYLHSRGMKLRNVYAYARDHYTYGLPFSHTLFLDSPDKGLIRDQLLTQYAPDDVYVITAAVTLTDFTYWAEEYLTKVYGYDRLLGLFLSPPDGVDQDAVISYDIGPGNIIEIMLVNSDNSSRVISFKPDNMLSLQMYLHTIYRRIQSYPTTTQTETRPEIEGDIDTVSTTILVVDRVGQSQETTTVVSTSVADGVTTIVTTVTVRLFSRPQYFFYQLGSGGFPAFDSWLQTSELTSPYLPSVPLRINNKDVTDGLHKITDVYETGKKMLGKVGVDFDEISKKINENEQVSEIDFAYVQFGVALNSRTPECKRYIYRFMESLIPLSGHNRAATDSWVTDRTNAGTHMENLGISNSYADGPGWGGIVPGGGGGANDGFESPPTNRLEIYHPAQRTNKSTLDIELQWQYIEKTVQSGVIETGAKPGDCTVSTAGERTEYNLMFDFVVDNSSLLVRRQLTEDTFEQLQIGGLIFINHVYKTKKVTITAWDALTDEEEEGFVLPLSQELLREMSIREVTQMSADCLHIVLNCYKVVKKKWYQRGFFAILMIIVAVVLLVVTWGASAPASETMIGMAIATLTAAGVSATVALIIVASLTVLAGMIITSVLSPVLTDLFGPTWGPIIAMVAAALTLNWAATGSFLPNMPDVAKLTASDLIKGSIAAVNVYGKHVQGQLAELDPAAKIEAMQEQYQDKMDEIDKLTREMLGSNIDILDIQGYIEATAITLESANTFLTRTLMTGSDVAAITQGLITDFAEVGLYLPTTP